MKIFSKIPFWKQLENTTKKRLPSCYKKVRFPCTWKELFKGSNQKMSGPESFCIHRPTPKWLSNVNREWWGIIYNFCIQNAKAWLKGRPSQILPICTGLLNFIMSYKNFGSDWIPTCFEKLLWKNWPLTSFCFRYLFTGCWSLFLGLNRYFWMRFKPT